MDMLSADREAAVKKYIEFMAGEETGDYENVRKIGYTSGSQPVLIIEKTASRKSLDEILLATGAKEQEIELIKSGSRRRTLTKYKLTYAREALRLNYTLKAIGDNIKVSDVGILDMLRRHNLVT